jgi:AcrR family transcriptional regulator
MVLISDKARPPALRWVRPPQQARSQHTLDRILDAAEALVAEKGFDDTPVAEIARRAGSSVGSFYSRFADKDALLGALHERFLAQATATADAALDPESWQESSIEEIASAVVRFLVEIHREQRGVLRAFAQRMRVDPEFQARRDRLSQHIATGLSALLLAHRAEIEHADPQRAVGFALTMIFGSLEHTILFGELRSGAFAWTDDDLSTELARAFLAYLVVPTRPT